ncbi:NAD(P)/FAD-dependent oxidoreductase [Sulfobacillus thermosulfidooxidans]|uniref:NAD(P)/FAD-dependent oxidoreductase n=1 Tax=Sulfobacillus thermosulfidooxidans TaxID=28034 RepID=UPI0006B51C9C|nr:FAD-dependent oxidoreductase [Sulfobacillus thermosulfidooxidans]
MHKVVVLGSRFGGSATAYWLHKLFSHHEIDVTIVDQWPMMTYRPAMVMAAAGHPHIADQWHIHMARKYEQAGFHFIRDTIFKIDPSSQQVILTGHPPLTYDTLFVATGSDPGWATIKGLGPQRSGVCEDYLARNTGYAVHNPIHHIVIGIGCLHQSPYDPIQLQASLDVPGFEVGFLLDAWLAKQNRRKGTAITILTPAGVPGESLGPKSQEFLLKELKRRDIHLITHAQYDRVTRSSIILKNRVTLEADRMIWVPPYPGSELLRLSGLDDGYGWMPTNEYCRHERWPNIYAVGDVNRSALPKLGHIAMLQARTAVHAFWAERKHKTSKPYNPYILHVMWLGHGKGIFTLSDTLYGGKRQWVNVGRMAAASKSVFNWSYRIFAGWMPIMP